MEGRGSFQQTTFTHMLLANLSANYPNAMVISTPGCNLPGQTHGMPRMLHFDSRVRNFGLQAANTNWTFPLTPCTPSSFQLCCCPAVGLHPKPPLPLFPHLCLDAFPLHFQTSLYHIFSETVMGTMNGICEYQSNIQFISRPEH